MNLQEIHVGGLQTRKGSVDGIEDGLTRQSELVDVSGLFAEFGDSPGSGSGSVANRGIAFGKDENLVTGDVVLCNECSE
jgi:hypothetical protein